LHADVALEVARDLKLRGQFPTFAAGVHAPDHSVLLSVDVDGASIEQRRNEFSGVVALRDADTLGNVLANVTNGGATMLYLGVIGDSVLATVASKYRPVCRYVISVF
jgi:hypothetical protein